VLFSFPIGGIGCARAGKGRTGSLAPALEFAFEELVTLDADVPVGETPEGRRNIIPITGGTFSGPKIKGRIMPGGWDWQLAGPGGCFNIKADYMIQTDDGVVINVVNQGRWCKDSNGKMSAPLTTPMFEAPKGRYDWLNGGAWVGTLEGAKADGKPAVRIRFYRAH
jgi:Protein of unknown function (DUF3237)